MGDLVSVDTRSPAAERKSRARIDFLVAEYKRAFSERSLRKYTFNEYSKEIAAETRQLNEQQSTRSTKVSKGAQLANLATRSFRQMLRDRRSFFVRVAMNIVFA